MNDQVLSVVADDAENVWIGGFFEGKVTFGPNEAHETSLTSLGDHEAFVARYTSDGALAWARRAGSSGSDSVTGLALLDDASCLAVGDFECNATFGPDEPNETILPGGDTYRIFFMKLDP